MNYKITQKTGAFTHEESVFLKTNHYSESYRSLQQKIYFNLTQDTSLIGMAVYGNPNSKRLSDKFTLELRRFCLVDETARNAESWFLSRTLKAIRKTMPEIRKIITFADPNWGHDGTIYKATNFKFEGEEKSANPRILIVKETGKTHTMRELYSKKEGEYTKQALRLKELVAKDEAKVYNVMKKLKYSYEL